jgi:hypothetical protein
VISQEKAALCGLILVLSAGCATRTVQKVELKSTPSFQGQPLEKVIEVWGEIGTPEPDGRGGRIVTYRAPGAVHSVPQALPSGLFNEPYSQHPPATNDARSALKEDRHYEEGDVLARFWIGSDDRVYRTYFADVVWKKEPQKTVPRSASSGSAP